MNKAEYDPYEATFLPFYHCNPSNPYNENVMIHNIYLDILDLDTDQTLFTIVDVGIFNRNPSIHRNISIESYINNQQIDASELISKYALIDVNMINEVKSFLKKYNLLDEKKTFVVGFSGGYDSMCLLDILYRISKKIPFRLVALHLNHNWRGREAEIEQENCERYCRENNIEIYTEILPEGLPKTETTAREKRQEFFKKCYKKYNADGLFLAHTKSDNTETILYRLTKGTGVKGLCGILEKSNLPDSEFCTVYRPLIAFSRKDIMHYCTINKLVPNNDSSNFDTKYARNFLRHQIVSELKNINPKIDDVILNLSKIAISEQNIIKEYLDKIRCEITQNNCIITQKFINLSQDVQKKLIFDFLIEQNLDYDSKKVDEI